MRLMKKSKEISCGIGILIAMCVFAGCGDMGDSHQKRIIAEKEAIINELKIENNELIKENLDLTRSIKEEVEQTKKLSNDLIEALKQLDNPPMKDMQVVDYSGGILRFIDSEIMNPTYQALTIIGYNLDLYDQKKEIIDCTKNSQVANMKFDVYGSLYNFKIATITWDKEYKNYIEDEIICEYEEVRNKEVVFNSVLAEGIPNEVLTWTDDKGIAHEYLLGYDGYGFSKEILLGSVYK